MSIHDKFQTLVTKTETSLQIHQYFCTSVRCRHQLSCCCDVLALRVFQGDVNQQCCQQVTMVDRAAAEQACKDTNPIIDGRKANVNLAFLGAKPRSSHTSKS